MTTKTVKCDRCSRDCTQDFSRIAAGCGSLRDAFRISGIDADAIDLCPRCAKDFVAFFESLSKEKSI